MTSLTTRSLALIVATIGVIIYHDICVQAKDRINKVPNELREYFLKSSRSTRSMPNPKVYRCGDIGKDMVVNFVNKNYPDDDSTTGECQFRLVVTSHDICQIRVDFVDTELMDPVRGQCLSQFFIVEGAAWPTGLPPLCGINSDQHFYLHLEPWTSNASIVDFKVITVIRGRSYRFGVWLTQIDCSSSNVLRAPEGCTQYFLSETGAIRSFNYEGYRYLNGQNYQICIRPGKGVCGIRYDSAPGDFGLKKSILGSKEMHIRSGVGASVCGTDFILIPDGRDSIKNIRDGRLLFRRRQPQIKVRLPVAPTRKKPEVRLSHDRFCGGNLSPAGGEVINKPIFARVRSNLISLQVKTSPLQEFRGKIEALNLTTGFRLTYSQIRGCEDNETEMVLQPPIISLVHGLNLQGFGDWVYPVSRQPDLESNDSSISASFQHSKRVNSTISSVGGSDSTISKDISDDNDQVWDYLDVETDDDENDESDLYEEYIE